MSAKCPYGPALVVRLEVERPPRLYVDAVREQDAARVWLWINRSRERRALVAAALELAEGKRAA